MDLDGGVCGIGLDGLDEKDARGTNKLDVGKAGDGND